MLASVECAEDGLVRADSGKLRQVLGNLLSNTVKFTDRGGHVDLHGYAPRRGATGGADAQVRLTVRVTGIPTDRMESNFGPFVLVPADLTRTAEGAAPGLAIRRDLARAWAAT